MNNGISITRRARRRRAISGSCYSVAERMAVISPEAAALVDQPCATLNGRVTLRDREGLSSLARGKDCPEALLNDAFDFSSLRAKRGFVLCALSRLFRAVFSLFDQDFRQMLRWRNIGPFRGGRTRAICGVPSQPNVFYMAQVNGGVFKTTDFGRTWQPIFDDQPTGSIGALAVAVSNPDIIYVGSGEGLHRPDLSVGDGIYKSTDAGKTWTHLGLCDGQQIAQIAVDPRNPDRLFVAVAGHPYGPNEERGHLPFARWREEFRKSPLQRREHRRRGRQIDPTQSGRRLRIALGSA